MNKKDIQRKRNIELNERVQELETQLQLVETKDKEQKRLAQELIDTLYETKAEYDRVYEIIEKQRERYDKLIDDMIELKSQMKKDMWSMIRYLLFNDIKKFFAKIFHKNT